MWSAFTASFVTNVEREFVREFFRGAAEDHGVEENEERPHSGLG
jgi:hypothetical protein